MFLRFLTIPYELVNEQSRSKKSSAFCGTYEAYWSKRKEDSAINSMRKRQLEGALNITNDIVSNMERIIKKVCFHTFTLYQKFTLIYTFIVSHYKLVHICGSNYKRGSNRRTIHFQQQRRRNKRSSNHHKTCLQKIGIKEKYIRLLFHLMDCTCVFLIKCLNIV